jgi:hypothetical protein
MPLLNVRSSKKVDAIIRLEESTAKTIDRYAAFMHASADEVMNEGMEYIFAKDKDFQQFLEQNSDVKAPSSLRIKKPISSAASTKNGHTAVPAAVSASAK